MKRNQRDKQRQAKNEGRQQEGRGKKESSPRVRLKQGSEKRSDVGYGHPPKEHQFKPGESGNKKGRPKGAKSESTILHDLLNRKIKIIERGRERMITVLEAIHRRFVEDSIKGNVKSAAFLLNRYGLKVHGEGQSSDYTDVDEQILQAFRDMEREKIMKEIRR